MSATTYLVLATEAVGYTSSLLCTVCASTPTAVLPMVLSRTYVACPMWDLYEHISHVCIEDMSWIRRVFEIIDMDEVQKMEPMQDISRGRILSCRVCDKVLDLLYSQESLP